MESIGRIFVAVPLGAEARAALAAQLKSGLSRLPGRPVPPPNWHVTLRFIGELDVLSYEKLISALDQRLSVQPFSLRFGVLGAFPNPRRATVLWRALEGDLDVLGELEAEVSESLDSVDIGPDDRPFHPHLTLARIRPPEDVRRLVARELEESASFEVDRVAIFRTTFGANGAHYDELESFKL